MVESRRELVRDGIHWMVWEADGASVPGSRGARCLIFDGESIVRRVWTYPDTWAGLDDDALWRLLGPAVRVTTTPAPPPERSARQSGSGPKYYAA